MPRQCGHIIDWKYTLSKYGGRALTAMSCNCKSSVVYTILWYCTTYTVLSHGSVLIEHYKVTSRVCVNLITLPQHMIRCPNCAMFHSSSMELLVGHKRLRSHRDCFQNHNSSRETTGISTEKCSETTATSAYLTVGAEGSHISPPGSWSHIPLQGGP